MDKQQNANDGEENDDRLFYLECLKAQVSDDLLFPFTSIEDRINECFRRWKIKLQIEKQRLIKNLKLEGVFEKLQSNESEFDSDNINAEIKYFTEVLSTLPCNITIHEEFEHILQYDGDVLQCDHVQDSVSGAVGANKTSNNNIAIASSTTLQPTTNIADLNSATQISTNINKQSRDDTYSLNSQESLEAENSMSIAATDVSDIAKHASVCISSDEVAERDIVPDVNLLVGKSKSSLQKSNVNIQRENKDDRNAERAIRSEQIKSQQSVYSDPSRRQEKKSLERRNLQRQVKVSDATMLHHREENIMPFTELKNSIATPTDILTEGGRTNQRPDEASTAAANQEIAKHMHSTTDRNWIDILLFSGYYLVIIQKKQPGVGTNEWLNKYSKETGGVITWLSLPEAGKMCKVGEKGGVVAVLQIGRRYRCVAVVKTSSLLADLQDNNLELLYRVEVNETYNAVTCLNMFQQKPGYEPNEKLKFAAVCSSLKDGTFSEEIDMFYPQKLSMKRVKGVIFYGSVKATLIRRAGISNICTITTDKMAVTIGNSIACVDIRGHFLWTMPMSARVTHICCTGNSLFVCLQDMGHVAKIETRKDAGVLIDDNVLANEALKPSQVSVCGHEMLIREFILEEYRSQVIIRIMRL